MSDHDPTDDLNAINVRWRVAQRRFRFWEKIQYVLIFCMIGSLLYDISLPIIYGGLLMMPFFVCFMLAAIGGQRPALKTMRGCNASSKAINQRLRDDHYCLLTGEERR